MNNIVQSTVELITIIILLILLIIFVIKTYHRLERWVTSIKTKQTINKLSNCNNMRHLYFAYGSNCDDIQMKERCPESKFINYGYIEGFQLKSNQPHPSQKGKGVLNIVLSEHDVVHGKLYEISNSDLMRLDYEEGVGYPQYYQRIVDYCHFKNNKGIKVSELCYIYIAFSGYNDNRVLPEEYAEKSKYSISMNKFNMCQL